MVATRKILPLALFVLVFVHLTSISVLYAGDNIIEQRRKKLRLTNDFGKTPYILHIFGSIKDDEGNLLKRVQFTLLEILNYEDKYDKQGNIKEGYVPDYDELGWFYTSDITDQVSFHIDFNKAYLLRILKMSYVEKKVLFNTYYPGKRPDQTISYGFFTMLEATEKGKVGRDNPNMRRIVQYSSIDKKYKLTEKDVSPVAPITFAKKNKSDNQKDPIAEQKNRALPNFIIPSQSSSSTFEKAFGDTINEIDKDQRKQGPWIHFADEQNDTNYQITSKYLEGTYVNNLKTGDWLKYFPNTEIEAQMLFKDGEFDGNYKLFHKNGLLYNEGVWDRNLKKLINENKVYYENGAIQQRLNFNLFGQLHGVQIAYFDDGNIAVTAQTKNDLLDGQALLFNENGDLYSKRKYDKGKLINEEYYDQGKDGNKQAEHLFNLLTDQHDSINTKVKKILGEFEEIEKDYSTLLKIREKELELAQNRIGMQEEEITQGKIKLNQANLENKLKQLQIEQQEMFLMLGTSAGLTLALLLFLVFRSDRKNRRLKEQIEEQHKDIMDSITYAQRIQSAILPSFTAFAKTLPQSFILYLPKDIVAGDFYWMETRLTNDGEDIYFSAADCTGHGVPGAMMSVMCSQALTKCVKELNITQPALILDETTRIIENRFEKSEQLVLDGMDLALCKLNLKRKKLAYAGANNALWIIRDSELLETKADKQPIGQYDYRKPYSNHEIQLKENDSIYIFSDGFADQFGGEKGKKYKSKKMKQFLLSIQNYPMSEQKEILNNEFANWKGNIAQIDDVCIIGVKI